MCRFPFCPSQLQDPFSAPLCPVLSLRNLYPASLGFLCIHTTGIQLGLASWETPTGELSGGRGRPGKFFRCFSILSLIISATLRITSPSRRPLLCESTSHQTSGSSVQFSSVVQSCLTLCDPSTPGLPVHHHLLDFTQTHVHRVSDAIQPSHPLSSPSPPAPKPSQHQSLFQ